MSTTGCLWPATAAAEGSLRRALCQRTYRPTNLRAWRGCPPTGCGINQRSPSVFRILQPALRAFCPGESRGHGAASACLSSRCRNSAMLNMASAYFGSASSVRFSQSTASESRPPSSSKSAKLCQAEAHLIAFNAEHLRRILGKYAIYYNEVRTHISLGKDPPCTRPIERLAGYIIGTLESDFGSDRGKGRSPGLPSSSAPCSVASYHSGVS
jgi:hypothetical protein